MALSVSEIFSAFQKHIDAEQDLREEIRLIVRDLEQMAREILTTLQTVHQPSGMKEIEAVCQKARETFANVRQHLVVLGAKVPQEQYYRFHDHWRFVMQRFVFLAAFIVYLESEKLISRNEAADLLGVKIKREDGFHIDLEDFLMGLLTLADELSRFAVNSVTSGDYARPTSIARFVTELNLGFRLLNLKNDSLRKRYDALKYDLKKVEEVVYDLSIRGLKSEGSRVEMESSS